MGAGRIAFEGDAVSPALEGGGWVEAVAGGESDRRARLAGVGFISRGLISCRTTTRSTFSYQKENAQSMEGV